MSSLVLHTLGEDCERMKTTTPIYAVTSRSRTKSNNHLTAYYEIVNINFEHITFRAFIFMSW